MRIFGQKKPVAPQSFTTKDWEALVRSFGYNSPGGIDRLSQIARSMGIDMQRFYQNPSYSLLFEANKQGKEVDLLNTLGFSAFDAAGWKNLFEIIENVGDIGGYALTDKDKEEMLKAAEADARAKELEDENRKKSNTIMYIGIGIVVVLILFFMFKK